MGKLGGKCSSTGRAHHQLLVWQTSIELVKEVYAATSAFPQEETYGLTSQIRRAAVSIPSNIAEGAGRTSKKEFLNFLSMSRGSLCELETQLIIARQLGYGDGSEELEEMIDRVFGLLGGLMKSIRNSQN